MRMKDMLLLAAGLCCFRAHRKRQQQGCPVQDVQALQSDQPHHRGRGVRALSLFAAQHGRRDA